MLLVAINFTIEKDEQLLVVLITAIYELMPLENGQQIFLYR